MAHKGWGGLKNGELLKVLERSGFEVFVTGDQGIESQTGWSGEELGLWRCARQLADFFP
ncbi:MAG: hypothetical protein WBX22_25915 [Silvibacterium sp.]